MEPEGPLLSPTIGTRISPPNLQKFPLGFKKSPTGQQLCCLKLLSRRDQKNPVLILTFILFALLGSAESFLSDLYPDISDIS